MGGREHFSRCQHQHSKRIKRRGRSEERGLETRVFCLRDCSGLSVGGRRGGSDGPFQAMCLNTSTLLVREEL